MKEFQALGLDVSIINDEGNAVQLKDIEAAEDKEDTLASFEEIDSPVTEIKDEPADLTEEPDDEEDSDDYDDFDDFDDQDFDDILDSEEEEGADI